MLIFLEQEFLTCFFLDYDTILIHISFDAVLRSREIERTKNLILSEATQSKK